MSNAVRTLILLAVCFVVAPAVGQSLPSQMTARQWHKNAIRVKSRHYEVVSTLDAATTRAAADHMDQMYDQYARILSGLRVRRQQRLQMYLFGTQEDYLATLDAEFDADARGTAGLCATRRSQVTLAVWQGGLGVEEINRTGAEGRHRRSGRRSGLS